MEVKGRHNGQEQTKFSIFHTVLPCIKSTGLTPVILTPAPPPHYLMEVKEWTLAPERRKFLDINTDMPLRAKTQKQKETLCCDSFALTGTGNVPWLAAADLKFT